MKRTTTTFLFFLIATAIVYAQQISVTLAEGSTKLYTDLDTAISEATAGSTIYLSGGGFQIKGETQITKKLSIIGVGHKANNDNADGSTIISGDIKFAEGADLSILMGVHLSGTVFISNCNNLLIRYCNINSVSVTSERNCKGIRINQNYIRSASDGYNCPLNFTNNVLTSIINVDGGVVDHNVFVNGPDEYAFWNITNSQIKNNIITQQPITNNTAGSIVSNNMVVTSEWGDNSIVVDNWDNVFMGAYNGVNTNNNYDLKQTGKNDATDNTDIGIYGGTGFSNSALPPGPRIVSKKIADQTDENGNLRVQIEVKVK